MLQNKNNSIQYTPLLEKAVTPKLSLSYPVEYEDSDEDGGQEEVEGEVPYANAHVGRTPESTTPVEASKTTVPVHTTTPPEDQKEGSVPITPESVEQKVEQPVEQKVIPGKHVYEYGVDYNKFSNKIKAFLDEVARHGISLRVTSGWRTPGSKFSHHQNGNAVDFTPISGQS